MSSTQYTAPTLNLAPIYPTTGMIRRLRRRKGTFAVVFLLAGAAFGGLYVLLPKTYMAVASVIIAGHPPLTGQTSDAWAEKIGDPADMESQMLVIHSPSLWLAMMKDPKVIDAMRQDCQAAKAENKLPFLENPLFPQKPCKLQLATSDGKLAWLKSRIGVATDGRSRIIDITYRSTLPAVAQVMANALTAEYLNDSRRQIADLRADAVNWLNSQTLRTGGRLKSLEVSIERYRREHGLVNGQYATVGAESLTGMAAELAKAAAAQAAAGAKLRALHRGNPDINDAVLQSHTVSSLRVQLAQLDAQLARLEGSYHDPAITAAIRNERSAVRRALTQETTALTENVQRDYDASSLEVTKLRNELSALERNVGNASGAEAAIANMVSDAAVQRALYLDLARKANDVETERRLATGNAELVSVASLPDKVWFPKASVFGVAGLAFSTVLGCIAAYWRDSSDRTVRTAGAIQEIAGIRVVASIPWTRRSSSRQLRIRHGSYRRSTPFEESIRVLHARLLLAGPAKQLRVIMVTSSRPGEGKTSTLLALARFAAAAGRRVLAIEADLRHPTFARELTLQGTKGLVDYLLGQAELSDVVQPTDIPDLQVITAGKPSVASTELLSNERMSTLIAAVRSHDLVLLDTPPSLLLMDARVLAPLVDGVIYCARWGSSNIASVLSGMEEIRESGCEVSGVAICMTRPSQTELYDADLYNGSSYGVAKVE